ncbi:MAG: hypothetical protein M1482_15750 [Chloroflexi bacterium]|nr:hypothetical protein [Chloroflexota bacterium]
MVACTRCATGKRSSNASSDWKTACSIRLRAAPNGRTKRGSFWCASAGSRSRRSPAGGSSRRSCRPPWTICGRSCRRSRATAITTPSSIPSRTRYRCGDERAAAGGAFKEKNIFSGGTKDQFSLALRLAFALATLPQERGTSPSFIFLDEPLSSFDEERADALIYLLTEGEIARAFDQIFLISHVHVDERQFTHHVVLENGRVAASDLPAE